ncbi:MAG: hypothetical protein GY820_20510 [Gammaproteobacteria bacterium]|nr:hypothetical protein [Gammaproteobacteria bacterium]
MHKDGQISFKWEKSCCVTSLFIRAFRVCGIRYLEAALRMLFHEKSAGKLEKCRLLSLKGRNVLPGLNGRSPDLTPCDFFLWGFIKSKVQYETRPAHIPTPKAAHRAGNRRNYPGNAQGKKPYWRIANALKK